MRADARRAAPVVLAALGATLAGAATLVVGPLALGAYAALVLGLVLLGRAPIAVSMVLASAVLVGPSAPGGATLWAPVGSAASPFEALLGVATLATALHVIARGHRIRGLGPLALPVAVLAFALVFGGAVGLLGGNGVQPVTAVVRSTLPVVLVPLLVVNVLRRPQDVDRALVLAFAALALQTAIVVGLYAAGRGVGADDPGAGVVTSFAPQDNIVAVLLACAPLAARLVGGGSRPVVDVAGVLGLVSLVLSLRRGFYLALVLALLVVLVVGVRRDTRRLLVPVAALLAVGAWVAFSGVVVDPVRPSDETVTGRIAGLNPTAIAADAQDRYRVGERRNVLLELGREPIAGLGAGGTWEQRTGVSVSQAPDLRGYVHNAPLWFWMMFGVPGLVAYLWLYLGTVRSGVRIARRHRDPRARTAGLALGATVAGLLLGEQTATFVGPDQSMSVLVGGAVGLVAALWTTAPGPSVAPMREDAPAGRLLPARRSVTPEGSA